MGGRSLIALPVALAGAGACALAVLISKWKQGGSHRRYVPEVALNQYGKLKDIESFGSYFGTVSDAICCFFFFFFLVY